MNTSDIISKFISKITSDNYEIIGSGSIILFTKNSKLRFYIDDLCIEIEFKDGETRSIEAQIDKNDKKKFNILCTGFNNALGSSPKLPFPILTNNGYTIYFSFVAFNMNKIPYLIYTFYKGVNNE